MATEKHPSLAVLLQRRRAELETSQEQAAEKLGVTERQYRRWEKGDVLVPRVSQRAKLADFLEMPYEEFLVVIGEAGAQSFAEDRDDILRAFEEFLRQRGE